MMAHPSAEPPTKEIEELIGTRRPTPMNAGVHSQIHPCHWEHHQMLEGRV